MLLKERLRDSIESSVYLNYILYKLKVRCPLVSKETLLELRSAVVETLLLEERYYEDTFRHSLRTYINLCITRVLDRASREPDALNGDLVWMDDTQGGGDDNESAYTLHDVLSEADLLRGKHRFCTEDGAPELLTYYLAQIPDQQADVFAMKAVLGFTHEEVASLLNISVVYSKYLYREAQMNLRVHYDNQSAYKVAQLLGNVNSKVISYRDESAKAWNDWSWKECHAEPSEVKVYSKDEIAEYCIQRGLNYKL